MQNSGSDNKDTQSHAQENRCLIIDLAEKSKAINFKKLCSQGTAYKEQNDTANAAKAWQQALEIEPDHCDLQIELGLLLIQLNKIKEAAAHFEKAKELEPYNIDANYFLGLAYSQLGSHKAALNCWKRCLKCSDPDIDQNELRMRLGETYSDLKKYNKALCQLAKVTDSDPFSLDAYNSLAMIYLKMACTDFYNEKDKRFKKFTPEDYLESAKDCLLENLKRSPKYYRTHLCLGIVYMEQGFLEMAIKEFRSAVNYNPDDTDSMHNLGYSLALRGNTEEACEVFEKILQMDENAEDTIALLGNLKLAQQDFDKAEYYFKRILEINPQNANAVCALGITEFHKSDYEKAESYFLQALKTDPSLSIVNYYLGLLYAEEPSELIKAAEYVQAAIELDETNGKYWFLYGDILIQLDQTEKALLSWENAAELDQTLAEEVNSRLKRFS